MAQSSANRLLFDTPAVYRICVQGVISASWSDRLEGMQITVGGALPDQPVTTLLGEIPDQAALAGVLNLIYEMHLPMLSVERISLKLST